MHVLQQVREGKLVWKTPGMPGLNSIYIETTPGSRIHVHPRTATKLVTLDLVKMAKFGPALAEYQLSKAGREATDLLCECKPPRGFDQSKVLLSGENPRSLSRKHDWENERLLCKKCWRLVACVSRKTPPHGASRMHLKWGAICQTHWKLINPNR